MSYGNPYFATKNPPSGAGPRYNPGSNVVNDQSPTAFNNIATSSDSTTSSDINLPIVHKWDLLPFGAENHVSQLHDGCVLFGFIGTGAMIGSETTGLDFGFINSIIRRHWYTKEAEIKRYYRTIDEDYVSGDRFKNLFENNRILITSDLDSQHGDGHLTGLEYAIKKAAYNNMDEYVSELNKEYAESTKEMLNITKMHKEFYERAAGFKGDFSMLSAKFMSQNWRLIGAVRGRMTGNNPLRTGDITTTSTINTAVDGAYEIINRWGNGVTSGCYLWLILKRITEDNGNLGPPQFIPWVSEPEDSRMPPVEVCQWRNENPMCGYLYNTPILIGRVMNDDPGSRKIVNPKFIQTALGFTGRSWDEMSEALVLLETLNIEKIKQKII